VSHEPVYVKGPVSLETFFSPDHSIDTLTNLIQDAPAGSRIDIGTPGVDSWSGCTYGSTGCDGCTVDAMQAEAFPIFPAILNAVHKGGCTVRILTNDYGTPTCEGKIAPLDWFALQPGIEVRNFATVTFLHEKYVQVVPAGTSNSTGPASEGRKASVSSVNWSQTSFTKNREAGVILRGGSAGSATLMDFLTTVFEDDWSRGTAYVVNQTYSPADMATITSPAALPVDIPAPPSIPGEFVTPLPAFFSTAEASATGLYVSPDHALSSLSRDLNLSRTSLAVHIYQVTDSDLCYKLQDLHESGVNVTLLVSDAIYSSYDKNGARYCYKRLHAAGMRIRLTPSFFTFSHQKYWIVDGKKLGLSTGNWSPTDFNAAKGGQAGAYPPYPSADWQDTNRDIQFWTTDATVIGQFQTVMDNDFAAGTDYTPDW